MFLTHIKMEEAGAEEGGGGGGEPEGGKPGGLMSEHKEQQAAAASEKGSDEKSVAGVQYDSIPDWLDPQFFDEETGKVDVQAMQKSQRDFRQKTREKDEESGVPEDAKEYKFDHADALELSADDPLIIQAQESALKFGLSQEAYAGFMGEMMAKIGELNGTAEIDAQAEKEKLGPNHERVIADLSDKIDGLVNIGLFGEADYNAAIAVSENAEGVKMLNKLIDHYQMKPNIPTNTSIEEGMMSKDELDAMVGTEEYNKSPAVRAKVKKGYERLYGTGA